MGRGAAITKFSMDPLACVDLPALPLQLLLQRHPGWKGRPAAVVDRDSPQGVLLWVNEEARQSAIWPGLRYAAGLSLHSDLRAGTVTRHEQDAAVAKVTRRLQHFTPAVEPNPDEPGIFWLSAAGLHGLYPSLATWAQEIHADLETVGFRGDVAVGFTRFGAYAAAQTLEDSPRSFVTFPTAEAELAVAHEVSLSRLRLDPASFFLLEKLGIRTVGEFLALPSAGLKERFGEGAYRLHRWASNELAPPIQSAPYRETFRQRAILDDPESDRLRLTDLVERLLHPLLGDLAAHALALASLRLRFVFDRRKGTHADVLKPAAATLDATQIMNLVRLRFESAPPLYPVIEVELTARAAAATEEQLRCFVEHAHRDLSLANQAVAHVRAAFGPEAVLRARLRDGHLPEAQYDWEPVERVEFPKPRPVSAPLLVRRVYARPVSLPRPALERSSGPYEISGGWWEHETRREYRFAPTPDGPTAWVYFDPARKRWFQHGRVE